MYTGWQVTDVLFESPQRSIVFQCDRPRGYCLKLISDALVFQNERQAYEQMQGKARDLFLPIQFFCQLTTPDPTHGNCIWKGYYMQQVFC